MALGFLVHAAGYYWSAGAVWLVNDKPFMHTNGWLVRYSTSLHELCLAGSVRSICSVV